MTEGVFCHFSLDDMAELIRQARRLAIVAAPGIDEAVASAVLVAAKTIGTENVRVILDVDEENCRAGYGNVDGYSTLIDEGIPVRRCRGLRIGFVLADDEGFIFGQPPMMVEAPGKLMGCPNAVRATPEQIITLEAATRPLSEKTINPTVTAESQSALPLGASSNTQIGQTYVSKAEIKKIEESIRNNPVQDFDLSRVVRVFNTHVQFVEFSVEGTNLETHTVKLPQELLTIVRDKKTRNRLSAAFKIVSDSSKISGDKIRSAANVIRKRFIRSNPTYGGVILKSKMNAIKADIEALNSQVEKHKETVRDRFTKEAEKSKKELTQAFWRAVRTSPPDDLLAQISGMKPSADEAKAYLAAKLDQVFPDVEMLCKGMKVTFVTKDVTWATLNSPNFVDWLSEQFAVNKELKKPFNEYHAARQRLDGLEMLLRPPGGNEKSASK